MQVFLSRPFLPGGTAGRGYFFRQYQVITSKYSDKEQARVNLLVIDPVSGLCFIHLMKYLRAIIIQVFVSLAVLPVARADTAPLQFGVLQLVPYGFQEKGKPIQGYLYQLAGEMLQQSGVNHDLHLFPLPRLIKGLKTGEVQCVFIADVPVARALTTMHEGTGVNVRAGFLGRKKQSLNKYEDAYDFEIGVPAGVSINPEFDNDARLKKTRIPNYKSAVEMLLVGRIGLAVGNIDAFAFYARARGHDPDAIFSTPLVIQNTPMKLACSKAGQPTPEQLNRLDATLRNLRESGYVRELLRSYDSLGSFVRETGSLN